MRRGALATRPVPHAARLIRLDMVGPPPPQLPTPQAMALRSNWMNAPLSHAP